MENTFNDFKHVILIQHGAHTGQKLNSLGQKQISALIPKLKLYVMGEKNVLLLSSSAPQALDSAKIIAKELNLFCEAHEYFWSDRTHFQNNYRALRLMKEKAINQGNAKVIIMVTHEEYTNNYFPTLIMLNAQKKFNVFGEKFLKRGEMLFMNLEKGYSELFTNVQE